MSYGKLAYCTDPLCTNKLPCRNCGGFGTPIDTHPIESYVVGPSRNRKCECGSGLKFKHCCGSEKRKAHR